MLHSAAEDISVLSTDVVKADNLLGQLDVVTEVAWVAQVHQHLDEVLLLGEKLLGESIPTLLALLLGSKLHYLDTLLNSLLSRRLALARCRLARSLALHRRRRLCGRSIVLVYPLHVVEEVVATGEAMARYRSLTLPEVAKVRSGTVTVHAVRLTLVAKEACSRGELHTDARLLVAAEGLKVGVDVLAAWMVRWMCGERVAVRLTRSCT